MANDIMVSIVTPSFNGGKYIEDCILSIKNQTYKNIEHIIIDGGSNDNTLDIVNRHVGTYNMRYISEPDRGMYDALNKGFSLTKGNIMAWLNTDDMYMPWAIEVVVKVMSKYNVDWCTGIPGFWSENNIYYGLNIIIPIYSRFFIKKGFYSEKCLGFIQQESTFWKRELWDKAGGKVDDSKQYAGDFYLWKSFAYYSSLYTIDTILSGFRIHKNQKTSNINNYLNEIEDNCKFSSNVLKFLNKYLYLSFFLSYINKKNLLSVKDTI